MYTSRVHHCLSKAPAITINLFARGIATDKALHSLEFVQQDSRHSDTKARSTLGPFSNRFYFRPRSYRPIGEHGRSCISQSRLSPSHVSVLSKSEPSARQKGQARTRSQEQGMDTRRQAKFYLPKADVKNPLRDMISSFHPDVRRGIINPCFGYWLDRRLGSNRVLTWRILWGQAPAPVASRFIYKLNGAAKTP
jgi:hypothetical protein